MAIVDSKIVVGFGMIEAYGTDAYMDECGQDFFLSHWAAIRFGTYTVKTKQNTHTYTHIHTQY